MYDCDLCFTPMILADSFIKSPMARNNEFTSNTGDHPLVAQFAANNAHDFATASEMVALYSNGVDLNCGCPQRWAMKDGYGAHLLRKPELVRDLVLQVRNKIPLPYTVSVKIRIMDDIRCTVELCRALESAGVSFLTIHARTPEQRHQPINRNAFRVIRDSVKIPLIANGDVKSLENAKELFEETGCQGVMAARGILANPALFAGYSVTPLDCVKRWLEIALQVETHFQIFHHHLNFMLEKILPKSERIFFNSLKSTKSVIKFLEDYCGIVYNTTGDSMHKDFVECKYEDIRNNFSEKFEQKERCKSFCEDYLETSSLNFM